MHDPQQAALRLLGRRFGDAALLCRALTHRSFVNEAGDAEVAHNERLEFLGDAVLNLCVSRLLMERLPAASEGELTKLRAGVVSEASLGARAAEIGLGELLRLGRGEELSGGRQRISILADAFEAVVGAVFLDGGFSEVDDVVRRLLAPTIEAAVDGSLAPDHKTRLQELAQQRWRQMPRYEVIEEQGPDHAKRFQVAVSLGEREVARGEGASKKAAEQLAARRALEALGLLSPDPR